MRRSIFSLVSLIPLTFAACGGGSNSADCTPSGGTNKAQYVLNTVSVPVMTPKDFGIDLDGDGKVDNALGTITTLLSTEGLDVQSGVDMSLMGGSLILLIQENSTDSAFMSDSCANSTLQLGMSTTNPDFTGSGKFTVAPGEVSASFNGPVTAGKFNSASPARTTMNVVASVMLPLVSGGAPLSLTLQGAHLTYTRTGTGLMNGGLQGAIKATDVQGTIVPTVAQLLTNKLKTDMPPTSTDTDIKMLFDTGGGMPDPSCPNTCKNPTTGMDPQQRAGMCAVAMDGIIDVCEVSTSATVQNLLGPDVQLFDAQGNYKPNPAKTMKDSLSVGLGFTAVSATF